MLDDLMVTLVIIILIASVLLLIRLLIPFLKQQIAMTRLIIGIYYCYGVGIIWECYRILYYVFTGSADVPFGQLAFLLKCFFMVFLLLLIFQMLSIAARQSGRGLVREKFIRNFYFVAAIIFSVLNGYTLYYSYENEFGFFTYQIHPMLAIPFVALYSPLLILHIIGAANTIKEITNKTIAKQLSLFSFLLVVIIVERGLILTLYNVLLSSLAIVIDLFIILFIIVASLILFTKNLNLLEELSTYFSVRSFYLIWKEGGHLIYGYDFQKEGAPDRLTLDGLDPQAPDRLLLGGLIYAISEGLEESLKTKGKLTAIKIGDITLILEHGKYVIGILFLTEKTPLAHQKLLTLMERFEHHFQIELERWMGDLTIMSSDTIQNWINELFR
ncbi:MAG: hypothetical protein HWN65_13030 [Candidatus Helarchaeota archaeon]|nr:hypothetical protein [Candidatus Helarchaeota archaeon]